MRAPGKPENVRRTLLVLAEWESARCTEILRRVSALLELHREHSERRDVYLARAKEACTDGT